ncbi:MAG: AI-2E family transporter [Patescibacteria group bacterium]|nr:AI-2E family transporter [Patescibacteria group bacterium]MDE1945787.1 AI-2E family transporter [Patescibacteria group bacterium]
MDSDKRTLSVTITPSSIFKGILLVLLVWFLFYIKDIVLVVLTAVVLASGIEPVIQWLSRFKLRRVVAAIVSYLCLIAVFSGLMYFFVPAVLDETSSFLTELPNYLDSTTLWNPLNIPTSDVTASQKVVSTVSQGLNNPSALVKTAAAKAGSSASSGTFGIGDLIEGVQNLTSSTSGSFFTIVSSVFGGLLSFILIIVLSFYLAVQEDGVAKFLDLVTPVKHEKYVVDLWKRSQKKIGQWMQGQLLLGVLVGVLLYLGLMILGVKNALLLALISGALEIIPVFGPIIASIPSIIMGFTGGGVTLALLVIGLYVIVQQFESHLIYPLVVRKIIGVSPILVILSLIIGAKLAGFLGIVLAVPLISILMEFMEDVEKRKVLFWKKASELEHL